MKRTVNNNKERKKKRVPLLCSNHSISSLLGKIESDAVGAGHLTGERELGPVPAFPSVRASVSTAATTRAIQGTSPAAAARPDF